MSANFETGRCYSGAWSPEARASAEGLMDWLLKAGGGPVTAPIRIVLGASDPEMSMIETLAKAAGVEVATATVAGVRVHPGNAYKADGPAPMAGDLWVECAPAHVQVFTDMQAGGIFLWATSSEALEPMVLHGRDALMSLGIAMADHHAPGDPGWGKGPAEYWAASSLGQVALALSGDGRMCQSGRGPDTFQGQMALGWAGHVVAGDESLLLMVAAADHSPAAAYAGECPGVDPEALGRFRAATRATHQNRSVAEVLADVAKAVQVLEAAPALSTPTLRVSVCDLRGQEIPELPEAALRAGMAYLATPRPGPDGRQKVVLGGHTTPEIVDAFMAGEMVPGLVDYYGSPVRGYAGGYLPQGVVA